MNRHKVKYFRCEACGFVQTEEPYWLGEAYSKPITASDTGLVSRNLGLARITQSILRVCFRPEGRFLDYAGGYGLLVRLMRDAGFDFRWYDKYCDNLFAQGFQATLDNIGTYDLVTAFEVLEHVLNPLEEIKSILTYSRNILFTTEIMPPFPPQFNKWWYYGLDHGQHISFFTIESLGILARKLSLKYYTNGTSVHLLTDKSISPVLFRLAAHSRIASLISMVSHGKTLLMSDYETLRRTT